MGERRDIEGRRKELVRKRVEVLWLMWLVEKYFWGGLKKLRIRLFERLMFVLKLFVIL